MYTRFWSENLKGRDNLEDLGEDGRIIMMVMMMMRKRRT
jgi:hypothetical protein